LLSPISNEEYYKIRPIFEHLPRTAVDATLSGVTSGRIYVDDPRHPQSAFFWNEYHFSYLAGDPTDEGFLRGLVELLEGELLPEARRSSDPTLVLYPDSPDWIDILDVALRAYHPSMLFRSLHRFDRRAFERRAGFLEALSPVLRLQPIDAELCARFPELGSTYELLWGSVHNFLTQGFGFCLIAGDELASACYSVFCASGRTEIGVETGQAYRRQGFARQVTTAFIQECLNRGLQPAWECWWENEPSRKLAACLGFEWLEDYPVLFIDLKR
jgi:GNAT superfamily N-acetyltransferase